MGVILYTLFSSVIGLLILTDFKDFYEWTAVLVIALIINKIVKMCREWVKCAIKEEVERSLDERIQRQEDYYN